MMRELGVTEAFGVKLGPPPSKLEELEAKQEREPSPLLGEAIGELRRQQRLQAARDAVRERLGAVGGFDLSDDQVDRYIDPSERQ